MAGDDPVAGNELVRIAHAEVAASMGDELVDLLKGARIEEHVDPLARRELAGFVLASKAVVAPPEFRAPFEIFEMFDRIHAESRV